MGFAPDLHEALVKQRIRIDPRASVYFLAEEEGFEPPNESPR